MNPEVTPFLHEPTATWTYVVRDPEGHEAVVIDPVLDYDPESGRVDTGSADAVIGHVRSTGLVVDWILETHAHADHLSAAPYLKSALAARVAIGRGITAVQAKFREVFNLGSGFAVDGSQFDRLLDDGERFECGGMEVEVIATPGHTSDCLSYRIGDAVFVGDTLFMPDSGTARCDFPGGDATTLYRSIRRLLDLPGATRMFVCHDYGPDGRARLHETTVAAQKADNIHVGGGRTLEAFVALRTARDATLDAPRLLYPSIQVNIRAGEFPPPEDNGVRYLKIPVSGLRR